MIILKPRKSVSPFFNIFLQFFAPGTGLAPNKADWETRAELPLLPYLLICLRFDDDDDISCLKLVDGTSLIPDVDCKPGLIKPDVDGRSDEAPGRLLTSGRAIY